MLSFRMPALPTEEMNPAEVHCEVEQERWGITESLRQLAEGMIRKEVAEMEIARIQAKHRRLERENWRYQLCCHYYLLCSTYHEFWNNIVRKIPAVFMHVMRDIIDEYMEEIKHVNLATQPSVDATNLASEPSSMINAHSNKHRHDEAEHKSYRKESVSMNLLHAILEYPMKMKEYEEEDEIGKLDCHHFYHMYCIKQWLAQKKTHPIWIHVIGRRELNLGQKTDFHTREVSALSFQKIERKACIQELESRYMKSLRKSIGVKLKEEAEFIEGEVVEIQIDHRKGDGMQLCNDHRDPLETDAAGHALTSAEECCRFQEQPTHCSV
ncbi:U11/U12 small nuclear ribonucleoprotein 48 kDa protein [Tanacetum coccineum]